MSSKILLFQNPSTPDFYIAELKKSGAERSRNMLIFKRLKHKGIEWTLRAKTIRAQGPAHLHVMALLWQQLFEPRLVGEVVGEVGVLPCPLQRFLGRVAVCLLKFDICDFGLF